MQAATLFLQVLQVVGGFGVVAACLHIMYVGMNRHTHALVRNAFVAVLVMAFGFGIAAFAFEPTNIASSLLMIAAAFVLFADGKEIIARLDFDDRVFVTTYRPARHPDLSIWTKLNPWWLIAGNADDGYWGDEAWRAGRAKTLRLALAWWLRNPCHNLTWYGIGVADRERVIVGPFGAEFHRPGGGWLWSITQLLVGRFWIALPYVSYLSPRLMAYAGWRPSGAFGFKFRFSARGAFEVGHG